MKYIASVIIYMVLSGVILSLSLNYHHKKCGTTGSIELEDVVASLLFPVAIGFVIGNSITESFYVPNGCNKEV